MKKTLGSTEISHYMTARNLVSYLIVYFLGNAATANRGINCSFQYSKHPHIWQDDDNCRQFRSLNGDPCRMLNFEAHSVKASTIRGAVEFHVKMLFDEDDKIRHNMQCTNQAALAYINLVKDLPVAKCSKNSQQKWTKVTEIKSPDCYTWQYHALHLTGLSSRSLYILKQQAFKVVEGNCDTFNRVRKTPCVLVKERILKVTMNCSSSIRRFEGNPLGYDFWAKHSNHVKAGDIIVDEYSTADGGESESFTVCRESIDGDWYQVLSNK